MSIFVDHLQAYDSTQSASLLCLAMVLSTQYTTTDLTPIPVEHRILQDVLQMHPSQSGQLGPVRDVWREPLKRLAGYSQVAMHSP